jgi:hypothetical protein
MIEMTWSEFKALDPDNIKDSPCIKVMGGDDDDASHWDTDRYHFYVIPHPEGQMPYRIAGIASQIDASRGR